MQSLESSLGQPALEAAHDSAASSVRQRAIEHMQAVKVGPCLCTFYLHYHPTCYSQYNLGPHRCPAVQDLSIISA